MQYISFSRKLQVLVAVMWAIHRQKLLSGLFAKLVLYSHVLPKLLICTTS